MIQIWKSGKQRYDEWVSGTNPTPRESPQPSPTAAAAGEAQAKAASSSAEPRLASSADRQPGNLLNFVANNPVHRTETTHSPTRVESNVDPIEAGFEPVEAALADQVKPIQSSQMTAHTIIRVNPTSSTWDMLMGIGYQLINPLSEYRRSPFWTSRPEPQKMERERLSSRTSGLPPLACRPRWILMPEVSRT